MDRRQDHRGKASPWRHHLRTDNIYRIAARPGTVHPVWGNRIRLQLR